MILFNNSIFSSDVTERSSHVTAKSCLYTLGFFSCAKLARQYLCYTVVFVMSKLLCKSVPSLNLPDYFVCKFGVLWYYYIPADQTTLEPVDRQLVELNPVTRFYCPSLSCLVCAKYHFNLITSSMSGRPNSWWWISTGTNNPAHR